MPARNPQAAIGNDSSLAHFPEGTRFATLQCGGTADAFSLQLPCGRGLDSLIQVKHLASAGTVQPAGSWAARCLETAALSGETVTNER